VQVEHVKQPTSTRRVSLGHPVKVVVQEVAIGGRVRRALQRGVAVPAIADRAEDQGLRVNVLDGIGIVNGALDQLVVSWRIGVDLRVRLSPQVRLVVEAVVDLRSARDARKLCAQPIDELVLVDEGVAQVRQDLER